MALKYRNNGPWGAGLIRRLFSLEVDGNFHEIDQRLTAVEENPAQPRQIQSITASNNQLTITLSDGITTFGPIDMPLPDLNPRDEWVAGTHYFRGDLFTAAHPVSGVQSLYMVNREHDANPEFNPEDGDLIGLYYKRVMPAMLSRDVYLNYPGLIPGGRDTLLTMMVGDPFRIAENFGGCRFYLARACYDEMRVYVYLDGNERGMIEFLPGANLDNEFLGQQPVTLSLEPYLDVLPGERLQFRAPDIEDGVAQGFSATLKLNPVPPDII